MQRRLDRRSFLALGAAAPLGLLAGAPLALAVAPAPARAQAEAPKEGADFIRLATPVATEPPGKIEVVEFFQYSCPHCFHFAPDLETWRKRLPADVVYKRIPVAFAPQTLPHAKLYYALEALNKLDDLHMKVFTAFHVDKRRLLDPKDIADFMAANGIDRDKWTATFDSFSVSTRATRAQQVWQNYKIDGTPMIGIDGRFLTGPSVVRAQSKAGALVVMDWLVERVRAERGKK
jgi:thiol:disulfide interchange protein DsbA